MRTIGVGSLILLFWLSLFEQQQHNIIMINPQSKTKKKVVGKRNPKKKIGKEEQKKREHPE